MTRSLTLAGHPDGCASLSPGAQDRLADLRRNWGAAYEIGADDGGWWWFPRGVAHERQYASGPDGVLNALIDHYGRRESPR